MNPEQILERAWVSRLMVPLSWPYRGVVAFRNDRYDRGAVRQESLPRPVISVGNIRWGGTGKTPLVRWLVQWLTAQDKRVAVLSRGYGRQTEGTWIVSPEEDVDAALVGDEPAMIREGAPGIWLGIGSDRALSGRSILARTDVDVFILDDGFQHRRLKRDLDLVLVKGRGSHLDDRLIPAGALREPSTGLRRAHRVLIHWGHSAPSESEKASWIMPVPISHVTLSTTRITERPSGAEVSLDQMRRRPVAILSGIGHPASFEESVRRMGCSPVENFRFADHHWFTFKDVQEIETVSSGHPCEWILTTEKDWQRLKRIPFKFRVAVVEMDLAFSEGDQDPLISQLEKML